MSRPRNRRPRMPQGVVASDRRQLERSFRRRTREAVRAVAAPDEVDAPIQPPLDWQQRLGS